MFRWILRGALGLSVIIAAGAFAAHAYGTTQDTMVLQVVTNRNTRRLVEHNLRLVDVSSRLQVRYTIARVETSNGYWAPGGSMENLLLYESEVLNPDEDRLIRRQTRHVIKRYDVNTLEATPLLAYTQRWIPNTSQQYQLWDSIRVISRSFSTEADSDTLLILHHTYLNKLFIFDKTDNYRHLYTISLNVLSDNRSLPLAFNLSPDETQIAVRYRPGVLLVMDIDGSNRRFFPVNGYDDFYPLWSADGAQILIGQDRISKLMNLKILDLESGQWKAEIENIVGMFPWWTCNDKWIAYYTTTPEAESGEAHYHMVNLATGRMIHLSTHPGLQNIDSPSSVWTENCQDMVISATNPENVAQSTYSLYWASFNFAHVRLLDDAVMFTPIWSFEDNVLTYQSVYDEEKSAVYRQPIDDSSPKELLGYVPVDIAGVLTSIGDATHRIYLDHNAGRVSGANGGLPGRVAALNELNLRTGQVRTVFSTTEGIWDFAPLYPGDS